MISEQSQTVIKEFLQQWWEDLRWKARETTLGTEFLPMLSQDDLYYSGLGGVLRQIAEAAEGQLKRTEENAGEVQERCQTVAEWMWARPGMPGNYYIPPEFWSTPIGSLTLQAHLWARRDELLTPTQATEVSGHSSSALSQLADRGKLTTYLAPVKDEPNPQRRTRYMRSEIEALPKPKARKRAAKKSRRGKK
jgi:hypothetical protein